MDITGFFRILKAPPAFNLCHCKQLRFPDYRLFHSTNDDTEVSFDQNFSTYIYPVFCKMTKITEQNFFSNEDFLFTSLFLFSNQTQISADDAANLI